MPHSYMDIKTLVPISNLAPELTLMLAPNSPNHHTPSDLYLVSLAFLILPLYQIAGGAQASTLQPFPIELFRYLLIGLSNAARMCCAITRRQFM